jgi:sporulation protein YlmC with PRC-barrel domain
MIRADPQRKSPEEAFSMFKRTAAAAALTAILLTPAFAQSDKPADSNSSEMKSTAQPAPAVNDSNAKSSAGQSSADKSSAGMSDSAANKAGFVQAQSASEWRASKLIGAKVYGPDNKSIGEINDIVLAGSGQTQAAVIGVGGFLGVGEKEVAVPFDALQVNRKANSEAIDKITVSFTKEQLKDAPKFSYYKAPGGTTTGSAATGAATSPSAKPPATTPAPRTAK